MSFSSFPPNQTQPTQSTQPANAAPTIASRKRHILTVADAELYRRLSVTAERLQQPIQLTYAPGWLGAIGQIGQMQTTTTTIPIPTTAQTTTTAATSSKTAAPGSLVQDEPVLVIGPVAAMIGMAPATMTAIHELLPTCHTILLADEETQPLAERAAAQTPNHCHIWPIQLQEHHIQTLLTAGETQPNPSASPQPPEPPTDTLLSASAVITATQPPPPTTPTQPTYAQPLEAQTLSKPSIAEQQTAPTAEEQTEQTTSDTSAATAQTHTEIQTPTHAPAAPLGDTDLVDAIISGSKRLEPLALKLIEQETGLSHLKIAPKQPKQGQPQIALGATATSLTQQTSHPPKYWLTTEHFDTSVATQIQATLSDWGPWLTKWLQLDQHMATMTQLAMKDELTGCWNRRYFNRFLNKITQRAHEKRLQVTVLVFDIDDFKIYNDRYGHAAGDEILTETARLIQSVVRDHDVVARIGGDEFAVIFWEVSGEPNPKNGRQPNSRHPHDVASCAKRFQKAICQHNFPKLTKEAPGALTVSGGLATYPWDGRTPQELLEVADQMAYKSKKQGKNAITFGPGVQRSTSLATDSNMV